MVKIFGLKKKRLFDEDADWVPSKGRVFTLKKAEEKPAPEVPEVPEKTRDLSFALAGPPTTDKEGLERAYEQHDAYTYGDNVYTAGTQFHTAQDVWDDVTKVPFWGDDRQSARYKAGEKSYRANPKAKRDIGHSLGGAVALELQKNYPGLETRTYGAPVWDPFGQDRLYGKVDRYRSFGDPVSFFDASANGSVKCNPFTSWSLTHAFDNLAENHLSTGNEHAFGLKNPDGNISLNQ